MKYFKYFKDLFFFPNRRLLPCQKHKKYICIGSVFSLDLTFLKRKFSLHIFVWASDIATTFYNQCENVKLNSVWHARRIICQSLTGWSYLIFFSLVSMYKIQYELFASYCFVAWLYYWCKCTFVAWLDEDNSWVLHVFWLCQAI